MSLSPDIQVLLARCDKLQVISEKLKEHIRSQDEVRKTIYDTNREVLEAIAKTPIQKPVTGL